MAPQQLTLEEFWGCWPSQAKTDLVQGLSKVVIEENGPRTSVDELSHEEKNQKQQFRNSRLEVYRDIVNYYNSDTEAGHKVYEKLWAEMHSYSVEKYDLATRIKRANEGKTSANSKHKEGNWKGALYTYAIAWGLFLPYHPDGLLQSDPLREELGKLEVALMSNISAMAVTGEKDAATKDAEELKTLRKIGVAAAEVCVASPYSSVGIVVKSCRRARELLEKQKPASTEQTNKVQWFKSQEEALKSLDQTKLFKDAPAESKIA